jgi:hypothetical protein
MTLQSIFLVLLLLHSDTVSCGDPLLLQAPAQFRCIDSGGWGWYLCAGIGVSVTS